MTIDAAKFRADFPAFADTGKYTDAQITFWLGLAALRLNATRFADMLDFATELFVAHNLTLAGRADPGAVAAPVSASSVDKVSVTYDTSAVTLADAGAWNGTSYGIQFWQLVQMAGAGGVLI